MCLSLPKIYGLGGRSAGHPFYLENGGSVIAAPGSLRRVEFYEPTSELRVNLQPRSPDAKEAKEHGEGESRA